jgi:Recombination endonuclease VII
MGEGERTVFAAAGAVAAARMTTRMMAANAQNLDSSTTAARRRQRAQSNATALWKRNGIAGDGGALWFDYNARVIAQGGMCAYCGKPPKNEKRLDYEHDHATGAIRGLTHRACNLRIGSVEKGLNGNPETIALVQSYLAGVDARTRAAALILEGAK